MDDSYVTMAAGFVWGFQYVKQFEIWHSIEACGKDADCWQALYSKITMLKLKKDLVSDCKLIFCIICT